MKQKLLKSIIIILIMLTLTLGYIIFSEYYSIKNVISESNKCVATINMLKDKTNLITLKDAERNTFNKNIALTFNIYTYNLKFLNNYVTDITYISKKHKKEIADYSAKIKAVTKENASEIIIDEILNCENALIKHMDVLERLEPTENIKAEEK